MFDESEVVGHESLLTESFNPEVDLFSLSESTDLFSPPANFKTGPAVDEASLDLSALLATSESERVSDEEDDVSERLSPSPFRLFFPSTSTSPLFETADAPEDATGDVESELRGALESLRRERLSLADVERVVSFVLEDDEEEEADLLEADTFAPTLHQPTPKTATTKNPLLSALDLSAPSCSTSPLVVSTSLPPPPPHDPSTARPTRKPLNRTKTKHPHSPRDSVTVTDSEFDEQVFQSLIMSHSPVSVPVKICVDRQHQPTVRKKMLMKKKPPPRPNEFVDVGVAHDAGEALARFRDPRFFTQVQVQVRERERERERDTDRKRRRKKQNVKQQRQREEEEEEEEIESYYSCRGSSAVVSDTNSLQPVLISSPEELEADDSERGHEILTDSMQHLQREIEELGRIKKDISSLDLRIQAFPPLPHHHETEFEEWRKARVDTSDRSSEERSKKKRPSPRRNCSPDIDVDQDVVEIPKVRGRRDNVDDEEEVEEDLYRTGTEECLRHYRTKCHLLQQKLELCRGEMELLQGENGRLREEVRVLRVREQLRERERVTVMEESPKREESPRDSGNDDEEENENGREMVCEFGEEMDDELRNLKEKLDEIEKGNHRLNEALTQIKSQLTGPDDDDDGDAAASIGPIPPSRKPNRKRKTRVHHLVPPLASSSTSSSSSTLLASASSASLLPFPVENFHRDLSEVTNRYQRFVDKYNVLLEQHAETQAQNQEYRRRIRSERRVRREYKKRVATLSQKLMELKQEPPRRKRPIRRRVQRQEKDAGGVVVEIRNGSVDVDRAKPPSRSRRRRRRK